MVREINVLDRRVPANYLFDHKIVKKVRLSELKKDQCNF